MGDYRTTRFRLLPFLTRCGFYPKLYFLSRLGLHRGKRGRARQLGECDVRVVSGGDTAAGELPSSNLIHTNLFLLPMSHTREQHVSQCRLMWKKGRYVNANGEIAYTRVAHGEKNNECVNASFGSEFRVPPDSSFAYILFNSQLACMPAFFIGTFAYRFYTRPGALFTKSLGNRCRF